MASIVGTMSKVVIWNKGIENKERTFHVLYSIHADDLSVLYYG